MILLAQRCARRYPCRDYCDCFRGLGVISRYPTTEEAREAKREIEAHEHPSYHGWRLRVVDERTGQVEMGL